MTFEHARRMDKFDCNRLTAFRICSFAWISCIETSVLPILVSVLLLVSSLGANEIHSVDMACGHVTRTGLVPQDGGRPDCSSLSLGVSKIT